MRYLSVCSGIEAATVAWHPLGWAPWAFAEVDKFPSAVLAHHYPDVPNLGDMTKFQEWPDADLDVLVGGTPCQSFSVAGLRDGLDDPRGSLMLVYLAIARRYRPRWVVWENVPGVLSSDDGRAFGTFLRGLADLGYGFAYRVLDAQHFGLAQRRQRVFVVGYLGDWRRAVAVLFERASLSGHPAPIRGPQQDTTGTLVAGAARRRGSGHDPEPLIPDLAGTLSGASQTGGFRTTDLDNSGAFSGTGHGDFESETFIAFADLADPVAANQGRTYTREGSNNFRMSNVAITPRAVAYRRHNGVAQGMQVRRLTPRECERLQGFPDDYTLIPYRGGLAADGPRYKALGNSMAVPVMRWIGARIHAVEAL